MAEYIYIAVPAAAAIAALGLAGYSVKKRSTPKKENRQKPSKGRSA